MSPEEIKAIADAVNAERKKIEPEVKKEGEVETVPCPACGASLDKEYKYCPECGAPLNWD